MREKPSGGNASQERSRMGIEGSQSASPSVHAGTVPGIFLGIVGGFFTGRLFGGILGGAIALVLVLAALLLARRRPEYREPLVAGSGALGIGFLGVLAVAWLNS